MPMNEIEALVAAMPKVELHVHIEGTLEPELMFALAARNGATLPWPDVETARAAYAFTDLQSFLDVYYLGAGVLRTAHDFYDLGMTYLARAALDRVRHAEVFFDPQTHTQRGVAIAEVVDGLLRASTDAHALFGVSSFLVPCFLRHLPAEDASATFAALLPWIDRFPAFGLDSSEVGNPPEKFRAVFDVVRAHGIRAVAHAGEVGPPSYIWDALDTLAVARIDHGVRCLEDPLLVERLARDRVPLTVCPLSNVRLRVFPRLADHNLPMLLQHGLAVTVNSDDPAYFGGYLGENYRAIVRELGLGIAALDTLGRNAIVGSFLADADKARLIAEHEHVFAAAAHTMP
jgi:adenosine deaminase